MRSLSRTGLWARIDYVCRVSCLLTVTLCLGAGSSSALSLSLSQIGGTAINGQGVVGDTIHVAVDVSVGGDEFVTGLFPTLFWDQEGGNVLDIQTAAEGAGGILGPYNFRPINSLYLRTDSGARTGRTYRTFDDGTNFADHAIGSTFMLGFEVVLPALSDEALLTELITNGAPGPAQFRMGVATFVLSAPGTTTLGFYTDPNSTIRTVLTGAQGIEFSGDQVNFTEIPVSAVGFGALQIVVVPEPSPALLLGIGFAGLTMFRRRASK